MLPSVIFCFLSESHTVAQTDHFDDQNGQTVYRHDQPASQSFCLCL